MPCTRANHVYPHRAASAEQQAEAGEAPRKRRSSRHPRRSEPSEGGKVCSQRRPCGGSGVDSAADTTALGTGEVGGLLRSGTL